MEAHLLVGLFLFEWIVFVGVAAKAVAVGDRVEEDFEPQRHQGQKRVGAEENKSTKTREIGAEIIDVWSLDDFVKNKLAQDDSKVKGGNVDKQNWLFSDELVAVKDDRDNDGQSNERSELGKEIIGVDTINIAVYQAPEDSGGESDFDVFPSAFVDGGKEPEDLVVF